MLARGGEILVGLRGGGLMLLQGWGLQLANVHCDLFRLVFHLLRFLRLEGLL